MNVVTGSAVLLHHVRTRDSLPADFDTQSQPSGSPVVKTHRMNSSAKTRSGSEFLPHFAILSHDRTRLFGSVQLNRRSSHQENPRSLPPKLPCDCDRWNNCHNQPPVWRQKAVRWQSSMNQRMACQILGVLRNPDKSGKVPEQTSHRKTIVLNRSRKRPLSLPQVHRLGGNREFTRMDANNRREQDGKWLAAPASSGLIHSYCASFASDRADSRF